MRLAMKWFAIVLLATVPLTAQAPADGAGWFQLGTTLHTEGKFDEAITAFTKAVDLQFRVPGAMLRIARAYARKNDAPHALDWLEKSAAAGFNLPQTVTNDAELEPLRTEPRYLAAVQQMGKNGKPCTLAPEYKQFDFWVGEWDVTMGGQ